MHRPAADRWHGSDGSAQVVGRQVTRLRWICSGGGPTCDTVEMDLLRWWADRWHSWDGSAQVVGTHHLSRSKPCHRSAAVRCMYKPPEQIHLNRVTGRQQFGACTKAVYTPTVKLSWIWVKTSPETCRADLKRSVNWNCCILLVTYTVA
jgi:hypothetical protein